MDSSSTEPVWTLTADQRWQFVIRVVLEVLHDPSGGCPGRGRAVTCGSEPMAVTVYLDHCLQQSRIPPSSWDDGLDGGPSGDWHEVRHCLHISSAVAMTKGQGLYTQALGLLETIADLTGHWLYLTDVHEPRLVSFYQRRRYVQSDTTPRGLPCFWRQPTPLKGEDLWGPRHGEALRRAVQTGLRGRL